MISMKSINKKGFTLIELIAVIVIIVVMMVMAFLVVKNYTKEAKEKSISANALEYIKGVNTLIVSYKNTNNEIINAVLTVDEVNSLGLKMSGTYPDKGIIDIVNGEVAQTCLEYDDYYVRYKDGKIISIDEGTCKGDFNVTFEYMNKQQVFTPLFGGYYKIQLWGAAGGTGNLIAKASYTEGVVELRENEKIYVYTGQAATGNSTTFNGGGSCGSNCGAGGGATDVRLTPGSWNDSSSLASRIMVAAGAGGQNTWSSGYRGGYGGALKGVTGAGDSPTTGATQIAAGISSGNVAAKNGKFGIGGNGENYGGGGGGGYWGGAAGKNSSTGNGGGSGSSYISGHLGCVAIKSQEEIAPKDDCSENPSIECSYHYSGKIFYDTVMIAGNEEMPTFDGSSTMVGNSTNGYAKITFVGSTYEPET